MRLMHGATNTLCVSVSVAAPRAAAAAAKADSDAAAAAIASACSSRSLFWRWSAELEHLHFWVVEVFALLVFLESRVVVEVELRPPVRKLNSVACPVVSTNPFHDGANEPAWIRGGLLRGGVQSWLRAGYRAGYRVEALQEAHPQYFCFVVLLKAVPQNQTGIASIAPMMLSFVRVNVSRSRDLNAVPDVNFVPSGTVPSCTMPSSCRGSAAVMIGAGGGKRAGW